MSKILRLVPLLILTLSFSIACVDAPLPPGADCVDTTECDPGAICQDNFCTFVCSSDNDCTGSNFSGPHFCNAGSCQPTTCGDAVAQGFEECDDGNDNELDGCTNDCLLAVCGDRLLRTDISDTTLPEYEVCDDGNTDDSDACTSACEPARCGDGFTRTDIAGSATIGFEECDDANDDELDGCTNDCRLTSIAFEQLSADYSEEFCNFKFNCCDAAELLGEELTTKEACITDFQASIDAELAGYGTAITAGTITYDADKAGECVASLAATTCGNGLDESAACGLVFVGSVAVESACTIHDECAGDGAYCNDSGVCEVYPGPVAVDGDCDYSTGLYCDSGLYCDTQDTNTCLSYPVGGEDCIWGSVCAQGFACHTDGIGGGTCGALFVQDDDCNNDIECATGLSCIQADSTTYPGSCTAPVANGEYCSSRLDCQSDYCDWGNGNICAEAPAPYCDGQ